MNNGPTAPSSGRRPAGRLHYPSRQPPVLPSTVPTHRTGDRARYCLHPAAELHLDHAQTATHPPTESRRAHHITASTQRNRTRPNRTRRRATQQAATVLGRPPGGDTDRAKDIFGWHVEGERRAGEPHQDVVGDRGLVVQRQMTVELRVDLGDVDLDMQPIL